MKTFLFVVLLVGVILSGCSHGPLRSRTPATTSLIALTLNEKLARDEADLNEYPLRLEDNEASTGLAELGQAGYSPRDTWSAKNRTEFDVALAGLKDRGFTPLTEENYDHVLSGGVFGSREWIVIRETRKNTYDGDEPQTFMFEVVYGVQLVPATGVVSPQTVVPQVHLQGFVFLRCSPQTKKCELEQVEWRGVQIEWGHMPSTRQGGDSSAGGGR
jgi:hypothetical protein